MEVYIVEEFDITNGRVLLDTSAPYVSANKAMTDYLYRDLEWKYITTTKFGGTVLERWEANYSNEIGKYLYVLESQHVIGSND